MVKSEWSYSSEDPDLSGLKVKRWIVQSTEKPNQLKSALLLFYGNWEALKSLTF